MPLGAGSACSAEQVLMEERQLDGVGDLLDLIVEAADVGVGDVGHLLEHQLVDLGPGQLLEQHLAAGVHEHHVTGTQARAAERVAELGHTLLVGTTDDEGAAAVAQHLADGDDLAGRSPGCAP